MTDPQTAADAAERNDVAAARVQAWLDGHSPIPPKGAVRSLLWERAELLADCARMAAELEQVRGERGADLVAVVAMLDGVDHYRVWLADAYDPDVPAPDPATAIYRRAHELRARFAGRLFAAGYDPEAPGVAATRPTGGSDAGGAGKGPESP